MQNCFVRLLEIFKTQFDTKIVKEGFVVHGISSIMYELSATKRLQRILCELFISKDDTRYVLLFKLRPENVLQCREYLEDYYSNVLNQLLRKYQKYLDEPKKEDNSSALIKIRFLFEDHLKETSAVLFELMPGCRNPQIFNSIPENIHELMLDETSSVCNFKQQITTTILSEFQNIDKKSNFVCKCVFSNNDVNGVKVETYVDILSEDCVVENNNKYRCSLTIHLFSGWEELDINVVLNEILNVFRHNKNSFTNIGTILGDKRIKTIFISENNKIEIYLQARNTANILR